ncbi:hypothetical protein [Fundidesulfovibrio terrae]|uniref:hypothetical protein n=1 Tax=Fundidesulfovibrio terrae TaxID=2922866 RepID=UPI001FAF67CA|nr:hypothetical protein [Fundidesulfovibrio terrae]
MSLFSVKQPGGAGVQQWASAITVGKSLKDLYASQGDVTLIGANTVATLQDGPEKVVRYGNLTLGDGTTATSLTASNRCKGLTIICDNLTVRNNATLNMTGKGARVMTNDDPFFPFVDFRIPNQITLSSSQITLAQALATIKAQGFAPWDQGTWQHLVSSLYGFNLSVSQTGTLALMLASGCGIGVNGGRCANSGAAGGSGTAGVNGGTGSGGSGAAWSSGTVWAGYSGAGCPYAGGSGSGGASAAGGYGGCSSCGKASSQYSGPGGGGGIFWYNNWGGQYTQFAEASYGSGGAGNPGGSAANDTGQGGSGCGGKLTIICFGTVTIQSGGKIEANGIAGGSGVYSGGGGSGGGHISIVTPLAALYSNNGTVQASGGAGGTSSGGYSTGGPGGAGSVITKTFSDLGWM